LLYTEDLLLVKNKIRPNVLPISNSSLDGESVLIKSFKDNLHNLNTLYFSGGEPLLHDKVWELLKLANERGYSNNISLKFNTNGTIKLNQEKYNILKGFKSIGISVSMDGIEKHAEYIRTNIVWDRWIENLKEYQREFANYSNFNIGIVCTLSVFNIHKFDIIKKYFNSIGFHIGTNMLIEPKQFCVFNINQLAKDYLNELYKDTYTEILDFVNLKNNIDSREIVKFIDNKDDIVIANNLYKNYRAFRDIDPEWYEMLKG
jgi:MoaA/NifB/PqqE/SkfB family radical SAM enzyme